MKLRLFVPICCLILLAFGYQAVGQTSLTTPDKVIPPVELTPEAEFGDFVKPANVEMSAPIPETVFSALLVLGGVLLMTRRRHA